MTRTRRNTIHLRVAPLAFALLIGCTQPRPRPFASADVLADAHLGAATAHYLQQPGADPHICGKTDRTWTARDVSVLFRRSAEIDEDRFVECLGAMNAGLPAAVANHHDHVLARHFLRAVRADDTARAAAMLRHRSRPRRIGERIERVPDVEGGLRRAAAEPGATQAQAKAWLEVLEIERGELDGHALTVSRVLQFTDDALLERIANRAIDGRVGGAAERRWIERRVRHAGHGAEAARRVLATGRNAVDPRAHPIREWSWSEALPALVLQQESQRVRLVAAHQSSPYPTVDLRRALEVSVEGHDAPLRPCGHPDLRSVEPCLVLVSEVPWARVDDHGRLQFADDVPVAEAAPLGAVLPLTLRAHGADVYVSNEVPVRFAAPPPFVAGGGADLQVRVKLVHDRVHWRIWVEGRDASSVVIAERDDHGTFAVVAQGRHGGDGDVGTEGCICTSDWGEDGEDGSPGEDAGDGGDIEVVIEADATGCEELEALVAQIVRSQGGTGGDGGEGGVGALCPDGVDGVDGDTGPRGEDGTPGTVAVRCEE